MRLGEKSCLVEDCKTPAYVKNLCFKHYYDNKKKKLSTVDLPKDIGYNLLTI